MIIKTLAENTAASDSFGSEHGLSLYIEAEKYKLLFDVGASGLFYDNASKLGVDIDDIDYLIISHGHYDHGGGLKTFLGKNSKAEVFIHHLAFGKHYAKHSEGESEFIGLDEELIGHRQLVFTSDRFFIGRGIQLFSNVVQSEPGPASNSGLFSEQDGEMVKDSFAHEQNLIIEEGDQAILVTGCAHNGIINIIKHFYSLKASMPDCVIGGFHLSGRSSGANRKSEEMSTVDKIGKYLLGTNTKYYTGHCTGLEAYNRLKAIMGDNIEYLAAGSEITI